MHCSVSAGPATDLPDFNGCGPLMCGSRMPIRLSSLLAVAVPIRASASESARGGRLMSLMSVTVFTECLSWTN